MRSIRWSFTAVLVVAVAGLSACKSSQDQQLADVPPPPAGYQSTPGMDAGGAYTAEPLPPAAATVTYPQAMPAAAGNTYTIRKGDTLWSIATRHYGDGKQWTRIVDANPGVDPKKLAVGQVITLP